MLIEIKNRYDSSVIFSHDVENNSIKLTLETAIKEKIDLKNANLSNAKLKYSNLRFADLSNVDFYHADLRDSDFSYADLSNTDLIDSFLNNSNFSNSALEGSNLNNANLESVIGNMIDIFSMQIEMYEIVFTKDILYIGCKKYTHKEWFDFDDKTIEKMDLHALPFWKKYKDFIFTAIKLRLGE